MSETREELIEGCVILFLGFVAMLVGMVDDFGTPRFNAEDRGRGREEEGERMREERGGKEGEKKGEEMKEGGKEGKKRKKG